MSILSQPSIKKNYIFKLAYEILCVICPFITSPYVARVLGADGVGIASYTSSIMAYFALFAALGTYSYGTREIARHRDDKYQVSKLFWEIELMTVFTSAVAIFAWIVLAVNNREYGYYFLALTPQLFAVMLNITWFYTGYEKIGYTVLRNALCKIIGIILLFAFVKKKEDLIIYLIINTGINLIANATMWLYLPKMLVKINFKELSFGRHFKETLAYFIPAVATSVSSVIDKTLVGAITGDSFQNGYYEQAMKIIEICKAFTFTALNGVMEARMSYLFADRNYDEIKNRLKQSLSFILLIAFGCMFGIVSVAKYFVPFFYGNGYEPVVSLLFVMAPLTVVMGISSCMETHYFTPSGRRMQSARYILIGALVNVILNLLLIPNYGAKGAAIGTLVAEMVVLILFMSKCGEYASLRLLVEYSWKRVLAGAVMCVLTVFVGKALCSASNAVVFFSQFFCGVLTYGVLLFILKDDMLYQILVRVLKMVKLKF